jgi:dTDP-4-amino-4,6-dideoxygalactose transaminase
MTHESTKIIGGVFGLDPTIVETKRSAPRFLNADNLFLVNGTSALTLLIRDLQPSQVWLPSYSCIALPLAARHAGGATRFYAIGYDLEFKSLSWLDEVTPGDLVVMIHYFGFPISSKCVDLVRARGALVAEDATQALLSDGVGSRGDFAIFSPRKFLGVPDGGILLLNRPLDIPDAAFAAPPAIWWLKAFNATALRREFDIHGGSRDWFRLFQEAEATAPVGSFRMSELSRTLLTHCFDYDAIARRRQANFDRLAADLADMALFPIRPSSVVPLAFPIQVKDRDRVRTALFARNIYPPVHWDLKGVVPTAFTDSHRLSSNILSLPCDQRYDERDMDRMITAVHAATGAEP